MRFIEVLDVIEHAPSSLHGSVKGLEAVLPVLKTVVASQSPHEPSPGVYAVGDFWAACHDMVYDGRPGLALLEPTTDCMHDTNRGHLLALAELDPELAHLRQRELDELEAWIQRRLGIEAPWHVLMRAFKGLTGLSELFDLEYQWRQGEVA